MKNKFDHLIWLGAGSATEPASLLNQAKNALLIDAREFSSQQLSILKRQHPDTQIQVQSVLISVDGKDAEFAEYNLPEYSATAPATGIKHLLPGLKIVHQEKRKTQALADIINTLNLEGNNNLLVIDIPDLSFPLLEILASNKLTARFSKLHIQASTDCLYDGATTHEQVIEWLLAQGFILDLITENDPDMPWINATINPLWQQLQASKCENSILNRELEDTRKQAIFREEKISQLEIILQQLQDQLKTQLAQTEALKKQISEETKNMGSQDALITEIKAENEKSKINAAKIDELQSKDKQNSIQTESLKKQLDEKIKNLTDQEKLIAELKIENEDLKRNTNKIADKEKDLAIKLNEQTYRNNNMEREVIKLEAQLELITNVLLREKAF